MNQLNQQVPIEFVASVGDIAHKGTVLQYEEATKHIQRLQVPFFALMGNEEFNSGPKRFMHYAARWNDTAETIPSPSYSLFSSGIRFVFASASMKGRDFTDQDIDWILSEFEQSPHGPIFLFTHPPAPGIFADAEDGRAIQNPHFYKVLSHPRLVIVFSGHLHMNPKYTAHYVKSRGTHHIHVPGLERTKIPAPEVHEPYFRLVTVFENGNVLVVSYNLITNTFDPQLEVHFSIPDLVPQLKP